MCCNGNFIKSSFYLILKSSSQLKLRNKVMALNYVESCISSSLLSLCLLKLADYEILRKRTDCVSCVIWENWLECPVFFCFVHIVMIFQNVDFHEMAEKEKQFDAQTVTSLNSCLMFICSSLLILSQA